MTDSFKTELIVKPEKGGRKWQLFRSFRYGDIQVPAGFITDFASVPKTVVTLIGIICIMIGHFLSLTWLLLLGILINLLIQTVPYWGKYGKASVVHDYLYQFHGYYNNLGLIPLTRRVCDQIFHSAMITGETRPWKARMMYMAVRLGGWIPWRN